MFGWNRNKIPLTRQVFRYEKVNLPSLVYGWRGWLEMCCNIKHWTHKTRHTTLLYCTAVLYCTAALYCTALQYFTALTCTAPHRKGKFRVMPNINMPGCSPSTNCCRSRWYTEQCTEQFKSSIQYSVKLKNIYIVIYTVPCKELCTVSSTVDIYNVQCTLYSVHI